MNNKEGHELLSEVIREIRPDTVDRNTIRSLKFMLKHPTFQPCRTAIEDKIIEIGNYLKTIEEQKEQAKLAKQAEQQNKAQS